MSIARASSSGRIRRARALGRSGLVAVSTMLALGLSTSVGAGSDGQTATVRHVAGAAAPHIGLIGDSTLSGVRWYDEYGELERFNFVFDAESCRRTSERSCWSREQYRPRNALTALQEEAGEWGEVLVVMSGYNDSADRFADGVGEMVAEAQRQGIGSVVWLSLRTKGVDYEEPLHLANGSTYRGANRSLYELAGQFGGYLQIADWATYSAASPDWFEADGAHLTPAGAEALTSFIASQVDVVRAGGAITPAPAPWEEVREGDEGEPVVDVQMALIAAGVDDGLGADGVFGPQTVAAVIAFQRANGLAETGAVDGATATALGLYQPVAVTSADAAPSTTLAPVPNTLAAAVGSDQDGPRGGPVPLGAWWAALVASVAVLWVARRRSIASRANPPSRAVGVEPDDGRLLAVPYDHESEHDDSARTVDVTR